MFVFSDDTICVNGILRSTSLGERETSADLGLLSDCRKIRASKTRQFSLIVESSSFSIFEDVGIGRLSVIEQEAVIVEDLLLCMLVSRAE